MNILIVGSDLGLQDNLEMYSQRALQSLGCKVYEFDYMKNTFLETKKLKYMQNVIKGMGRMLLRKVPGLVKIDKQRMNEQLLNRVLNLNIDLIFVFKGEPISADVLIKIKEKKSNVLLVNWMVDPFLDILPDHIYPLYDCIFTPYPNYAQVYYEKGAKRVEFLFFACDPQIHIKQEVSEQDKVKFSKEICFIGTRHPDREELFEELADFNLGIWGNAWNKIKPNSKLRNHVENRWLNVQEWTKVYSASKICINLNLPAFKQGAGVSMRVFEAMSCGIMVITDQAGGKWSVFKPEEELVYFNTKEELKELIKYYLTHDAQRNRIALNGQNIVRSRHTYKHRMEQLLSLAQELRKST